MMGRVTLLTSAFMPSMCAAFAAIVLERGHRYVFPVSKQTSGFKQPKNWRIRSSISNKIYPDFPDKYSVV